MNVAIVNKLFQGAESCDVVKKYGLSKSTISTILEDKEKILSSSISADPTRKRLWKAMYTHVEDTPLKWFVDARSRCIPVSGPLMLLQSKGFCVSFALSQLWCRKRVAISFKLRHE